MQLNNPIGNTTTNAWFAISLAVLIALSASGLLNFSTSFTPAQTNSNTDSSTASSQIERATSKASKRISDFATANPSAFTQVLQQSFGAKLDAQAAYELTQKAALGQLPAARTVVFVAPGILEGASGAYAAQEGGLILLDERVRDDSAVLSEVILHEWAHHLDASLGSVDAVGEEGDIFLRGIRNTAPLSPSELQQLQRAEHGHKTILWGGKHIAIELFLDAIGGAFTSIGGAIGGAVTSVGKGLLDAVESVGDTMIETGKGLVDVATNVAEGDIGGALGSVLDVATGPGNLLNKTAGILDKIQPGLGMLGQMALGATPLGTLAAASMGLADTVNGVKNGGLAGGLKAGLLAAADVGMAGVGRANKGLRAAGFKSSPSKLAALKKKTPILKNLDNYKLTRATNFEKNLGKTLMKPGNKTKLKILKKLDKPQVKYPIKGVKTGLTRESERNSDGVLLGKENNNAPAVEVCPEQPSQQLTMDVDKELSRLGYADVAGNEALGLYQEEQAVKYCETQYDDAFYQCRTSFNAVIGDACHKTAADMLNTCLDPKNDLTPENCLSNTLLTKLKSIEKSRHSDACKDDISDSVSACCDTNFDTAMEQCSVQYVRYDRLGRSYDLTCEENAIDNFNGCLNTQQTRHSTGGTYTEQAAPPMTGSTSYSAPPSTSGQSVEY